MLWTPSSKLAQRGSEVSLVQACHLLEEGAGLVDETLVLAHPDAGGVHRQSAAEVGVLGTDSDPAEAPAAGRVFVEHQPVLPGPLLRPERRAAVSVHLEDQAVRVAGGDPGDLDDPDRVLEPGGESGVVVILDCFVLIADGRVAMPDDGPERDRPFGDGGGEPAPLTSTMSPARNSARYAAWLPMSASAPVPGAPLNRQLIGPCGSLA